VKNGVVSQGAYDRPLDDVKRRVALDILAEVRRTIRGQSGDYVRLKVFYPTADKGKKSANEIFVIGLELGAVEISVSDIGIGISPEDQAKIFEEFRQVGGDYAHKKEGTGLGLTLAKKFVELHAKSYLAIFSASRSVGVSGRPHSLPSTNTCLSWSSPSVSILSYQEIRA
jgi:Histidine kinase-, DNA gyrase B-, and HSP90-like ATPase